MSLNPAHLTDSELSAAFESSCSMAASLYEQGADTASADANVAALAAELERREAKS